MTRANTFAACGLAVVAALLYFSGLASFAFPGESASLLAALASVGPSDALAAAPVFAFFARLFGGNALAPVCGILATVLVFVLVTRFLRVRIRAESFVAEADRASGLGGLVAALLFFVSPDVRSAATHLEPRLFYFTWVLLALGSLACARSSVPLVRGLFTLAAGVLWGAGLVESPLFIALAPLALAAILLQHARWHEGSVRAIAFVATALAVAALRLAWSPVGVTETLTRVWSLFAAGVGHSGMLFVALFAVLPFAVVFLTARRALGERAAGLSDVYHASLSFFSILALATPFAPAAQMAPSGLVSVVETAAVAALAGYLAAYWFLRYRGGARIKGLVPCGVLLLVYALTALVALTTFSPSRGAFADRVADVVLDELGDRACLVSDGTLDSHLLLRAAARGKPLALVSLSRDSNRAYLEDLARRVRDERWAGDASPALALSARLGVLAFLQDWFRDDSSVTTNVAVLGVADVWYAAGIRPVAETVLFGADPNREPSDARRAQLLGILEAPARWGSFQLAARTEDPVRRLQLELRRHLGLVLNNRAIDRADAGDRAGAYADLTAVRETIDADNVSALFNLHSLARGGEPHAADHRHAYEAAIRKLAASSAHRYRLWSLANYYGYIRDPEAFVALGCGWARSGCPLAALAQVTRASEILSVDRRGTLLNLMAALSAQADAREKSRAYYAAALEANAKDREAMLGLMRLELAAGNDAAALDWLDRALQADPDAKSPRTDLALAALMRGDLARAETLLKAETDANKDDARAWALLASICFQRADAATDPAVAAKELATVETTLLPKLAKVTSADVDYYLETTRGFLLLRRGPANRREARTAFLTAARTRPDVAATREIVLGLDMALNDPAAAEEHAREALRRNRADPLANYVMGSLELGRGHLAEAETYLLRATTGAKPVPMAFNDLAELERRTGDLAAAEDNARRAVKAAPTLYVAYETLASVLMDRKGDLKEAQTLMARAVELSEVNGRPTDIRMLVSLARLQALNGDKARARQTLRRIQTRAGELNDYERAAYEELLKDVR